MPRKGLKNLTVAETLHDRIKKVAEEKKETIQQLTEGILQEALAKEAVPG